MKFDLLTEPWIPVSEKETGAGRTVGIQEALLQAPLWGEIQCSSPLETTAILRMLEAILHHACRPADGEAWGAMWEAGSFPRDNLNAYLARYADRFSLFDEERPFMQIGKMTMAQAGPLAQLSTEDAVGNTPTLFDHTSDANPPAYSPAEAARKLLAAQSFALGFGKAAEAVVDGAPFPRPYLADGICLRGVTLFLSGESLFQTLSLNLIAGEIEPGDAPFWQVEKPLEVLDKVLRKEGVRRLAKGPAERYAWPSRMIRLLPEAEGMVRRAYFTQGREADKGIGDPMKVFVQSKTEGVYALGLSADKAAWRDLHSYLSALNNDWLPKVFTQAAGLVEEGYLPEHHQYGLNVVGLATDPGKAGKFLLWRHDRMSIPAALLSQPLLIGDLATAIGDAEFIAGDLRRRMRGTAARFLPPDGNPDPKDVDNLVDALDPRRAYWSRLEAHFTRFLLKLADDPMSALATWRKALETDAERALRASCEQLGHSTRAIKATAQVSFQFLGNKAEVMARIDAAKQKKGSKAKTAKVAAAAGKREEKQ